MLEDGEGFKKKISLVVKAKLFSCSGLLQTAADVPASFLIRSCFFFWDFNVFSASSFNTNPSFENGTHVKDNKTFQTEGVLRLQELVLVLASLWLAFNSSVWSELSHFFTSRSFKVMFTTGDMHTQCFDVQALKHPWSYSHINPLYPSHQYTESNSWFLFFCPMQHRVMDPDE